MTVRLKRYDRSRVYHLIWGPIAILFLIIAGVLKDFAEFLPHCLFHQITGYPCLTCGMTRSAIFLSQFDLSLSLHYNPLLPIGFFAVVLFSIVHLIGYLSRRQINLNFSAFEKKIVRLSVIVIILGNWAYLVAAGI